MESFEGFPDVAESHRHYKAVRYLTLLNVFEGYPDGTFQPDGFINRAEFMKILFVDSVEESENPDSYKNCFPDVGEQWFAPYVCYGFEQGIVKGYEDGFFHPERTVTKAEALKMLLLGAEVVVPEHALSETRGELSHLGFQRHSGQAECSYNDKDFSHKLCRPRTSNDTDPGTPPNRNEILLLSRCV